VAQRRDGAAHSRAPILGAVTSDDPAAPAGPPPQVRVAGALVALQALASLGFAAALAIGASAAALPLGAVLGEAAYFVIIGAALLAVGIGLLIGRRWARTPAIVAQLLLLPVVYTLLSTRGQLISGIAAGVFVATTFMLLISERSRQWSMGLQRGPMP
jgi:hypothetical protein